MVRVALLLLVLGGCDSLFDLDRVRSSADDGGTEPGDGNVVQDVTMIDAKPCTPIGHNEDTDMLDDGCDSCPTITNVGTDTDGDGLDDACDPNLGLNDRDQILFWTTFPTMSSLTEDFTSNGNVMWEPGTNGQVVVFANSVLTAKEGFKPTKIEVRTALVGVGIGAEANMMHSGATCQVMGSDCEKNTALLSCVTAYPNGSNGTLQKPGSDVRLIEMIGGNNVVTCVASSSPTSEASGQTQVSLSPNNLQFTTNSSGSIIITAIVIYGTL
jgi:hypothetical protein